MSRFFNLNDPVWVYEPPCAPIEGVVSGVYEVTAPGMIRVKTDHRFLTNRLWSNFHVFHRPAQRNLLIGQLRDHADALERAAAALENEEGNQ